MAVRPTGAVGNTAGCADAVPASVPGKTTKAGGTRAHQKIRIKDEIKCVEISHRYVFAGVGERRSQVPNQTFWDSRQEFDKPPASGPFLDLVKSHLSLHRLLRIY